MYATFILDKGVEQYTTFEKDETANRISYLSQLGLLRSVDIRVAT